MIVLRDVKKLLEARLRNGYSQKALAVFAKIHVNTIFALENGQCNLRPGTAKKLVDALGIQFDEVFKIV